MTFIEKKILPVHFEAILSGNKKCELRLNDFVVSEGDTLVLKEWNDEEKVYTGRVIEKKVTHVGKIFIDKLFWSEEEIKQKGLQLISIE